MMFRSRELAIRHLGSGGLITNYYCTSRCGHCLYRCSPHWAKKYIDQETTRQILQKVKDLGCHSLHVGGGEPFLDLEGLKKVLETAQALKVNIEYVETNSSWYRDEASACRDLKELKERGLTTILVSISPFHNEYIPFYKVKGVIAAARLAGISVFPWIREFYPEIDSFDEKVPHELSEYRSKFGENYLKSIPSRYWVHFGGRRLNDLQPSS